MKKLVFGVLVSVLVVVLLIVAGLAVKLYMHRSAVASVERSWKRSDVDPLGDIGTTETLKILPLVNWHAANDRLKTEMGVSYLVQTDRHNVLFDVGHNANEVSPSPLRHNMQILGIALDEIDAIFISHNHFDHVGGDDWSDQNTFSLGTKQVPLDDKAIFTPIDMTYPGSDPVNTSKPQPILKGVASIGSIPRQLFIGRIEEQSMAVNVKGKGIVLIVGCAHQTVPKIIARTRELFDEPIYGIIGDLHYPVPEGRLQIAGLNAQRLLASGQGPLNPLTREQVNDHVDLIAELDPGVVGVGGHDSSDQVIEQFSERFNEVYQPVKVGRWITVANGSSM